MIYSRDRTIFRIWSPIRSNIKLILYPHANSKEKYIYNMIKAEDGVHEVTVSGDLKGFFYTYLIDEIREVTDPYSVSSSLNSEKSAIIDLKDTNPSGWDTHTIPYHKRNCDAIIYEVHIKDFTIDQTSGVKNRGKYLGFVEENTVYKNISTGFSHLKELGVTHIHIMPVFDFISVDEDESKFLNSDNYNWGYDPELYNTPEGSYSMNPKDPISRIKDLKTMIMELHNQGFKVILDVVYNHTFKSYDSNFNIIMPGYYYRQGEDKTFSNGSGVGNEIASERPMVRKFIIDSLMYWLDEYKVDGFRFDLMALTDINTVEEAIRQMRGIRPDVFVYGEPWGGWTSALPDNKKTTKGTQGNISFGLFNDNFRNALKGDNDGNSKGYAQGNLDLKGEVETGIAGSIYYDDGHIGFASHPRETINYVNSHDNLIITDKIRKIYPNIDDKDMIKLNKFVFSILLTSQGIPFMVAGNEFLRTKKMVHNSYNSDLSINAIDWSMKIKNMSFFNYIRDLISLRNQYKSFRMTGVEIIKERLKFMKNGKVDMFIAYTLEVDKSEKYLLVIHNPNPHSCFITTASVKDHINKSYQASFKQLSINTIFDEYGLVRNKKKNGTAYGVEAEGFSTVVYELS